MKAEQYLRDQGVPFEHHTHAPVYTAQELAAEEHVPGRDVAKTVIVKADDRFAMCVLPACCKLDLAKAAQALGAKHCRLADESEMARLFPDVEIGAEPPFGNLYDMPTLVDASLAGEDRIVFASDSHREAIAMKYADYARLTGPQVADFSVHL